MFQLLKFDSPIPSCEIHEIKWEPNPKAQKDPNAEPGFWTYVYAASVPELLTNSPKEGTDFMIYEFISDLNVKRGHGVHEEAINIHFRTLDEYIALLRLQQMHDNEYRRVWRVKHPDRRIADFALRTLENRSYTHEELLAAHVHFISALIRQDEDSALFAAI